MEEKATRNETDDCAKSVDRYFGSVLKFEQAMEELFNSVGVLTLSELYFVRLVLYDLRDANIKPTAREVEEVKRIYDKLEKEKGKL